MLLKLCIISKNGRQHTFFISRKISSLALVLGMPPTNNLQLSTLLTIVRGFPFLISRPFKSLTARFASSRRVYVANAYPLVFPLGSIIVLNSIRVPPFSRKGTSSSSNKSFGNFRTNISQPLSFKKIRLSSNRMIISNLSEIAKQN